MQIALRAVGGNVDDGVMREEPAVYLLGGLIRKACLRQQPVLIRVMQGVEKFFVIYDTRAPAAAVPFIIRQPAA